MLPSGAGRNPEHGTRDDLLGRLAEEIGSVTTTHPLRVAIDGPPAAGDARVDPAAAR
jgi:hypothetical protein